MLHWQRPAWHSAMPLSFAGVLERPAIDGVCLQHTRFALPSRHAEGEVEGGEAAAESSKPKRGKAAKERKAKAAAAGGLQGEACHVLFGLTSCPSHMAGCQSGEAPSAAQGNGRPVGMLGLH